MAEARPGFQQLQYAFTAAVRNPDQSEPPGNVAPERMALYRELIFNNLESFIASGFPVLRGLLEGVAWNTLIREFLRCHRSTTPCFSGIPAEFLAFLRDERGARPEDPPFLLELAHYEWVELALAVAEDEPPPQNPDLLADPLRCRIVLSPVAWPLVYQYPVHRIGPQQQPASPPAEPTFLAVYRSRDDLVRFLEINAPTYRLLHQLEVEPALPATDYLEGLARELGQADPQSLFEYGAGLLRKLAERGVIGVPGVDEIPQRPDQAGAERTEESRA
jgi:hypothetical protein